MTNDKAKMIGRDAAKANQGVMAMVRQLESEGATEEQMETAYQVKMAEQRRMAREAATFSSH